MPFTRYIFIIVFEVILISCHKNSLEHPMPVPIGERPIVKLKDMIEQGLPSPYYHFEYNDTGYISRVAFASDLSSYDLSYYDGKVDLMLMNKDVPFDTKKDKIVYDYKDEQLTGIRIFDKNNVYYRKCLFTFSAARQLLQLDWYVKTDNTGLSKEQTLNFSYYPDGNLEKINRQVYAVGPQISATYQDRFEDYDDKLNADGFALLHIDPFFLDLLLLPSVHLQMNNPRKMIHTGDGANYEVNYMYTYDNETRPVTKSGDFYYTSGQDAGKHTPILTTFTYY